MPCDLENAQLSHFNHLPNEQDIPNTFDKSDDDRCTLIHITTIHDMFNKQYSNGKDAPTAVHKSEMQICHSNAQDISKRFKTIRQVHTTHIHAQMTSRQK